MKTLKQEFKVSGMHCNSCAVLIDDSLKEVEGVESVNVNIKSGIVSVSFKSEKTDLNELKKAIESEGYKVEE